MKKIYFWSSETSSYRTKNMLRAFEECEECNVIISSQISFRDRIQKFLTCNIVYIAPYEHSLFKIFSSTLMKKKILCDIYAPKFDTAVNDMKIYRGSSLRGRLQYLRDRIAMTKSDRVFFLTNAEADYFPTTVGLKRSEIRCSIIPLCIDAKSRKSNLPFFTNQREEVHIYWTGSFIPLQGVDKVIEAFELLYKKGFPFKGYIIGPDKEEKLIYQNIVIEKGLDSVVLFPHIWGDMNLWENIILEDADISLGIFGDSKKAKTVLANKVVDGVSFKTPVVTGYSLGAKEFFDGLNNIYYCHNSAEDLANTIISICNSDFKTIKDNVDSSYEIFQKNFKYNAMKDRLFQVLIDL